jgi:hypothetical protein
MSIPSGLTVFESADEIVVSMLGSTPTLSGPGLFCELSNSLSGLSLSSGVDDVGAVGSDRPLAYVQSGCARHGTKLVWFTNRHAADVLIARVQAQYIIHSQMKLLGNPSKSTDAIRAQLRGWIGTCMTAVFICFLGAGAANVGWKTFDPLAVKFAGEHAPNDLEKARMSFMAAQTVSVHSMRDAQAAHRYQENKLIEFDSKMTDINAKLRDFESVRPANSEQISQILPEQDDPADQ